MESRIPVKKEIIDPRSVVPVRRDKGRKKTVSLFVNSEKFDACKATYNLSAEVDRFLDILLNARYGENTGLLGAESAMVERKRELLREQKEMALHRVVVIEQQLVKLDKEKERFEGLKVIAEESKKVSEVTRRMNERLGQLNFDGPVAWRDEKVRECVVELESLGRAMSREDFESHVTRLRYFTGGV